MCFGTDPIAPTTSMPRMQQPVYQPEFYSLSELLPRVTRENGPRGNRSDSAPEHGASRVAKARVATSSEGPGRKQGIGVVRP